MMQSKLSRTIIIAIAIWVTLVLQAKRVTVLYNYDAPTIDEEDARTTSSPVITSSRITQEELAELGSRFFEKKKMKNQTSVSSTTLSSRLACHQVDQEAIGLRRRPANESLHDFKECMQRLESDQKHVRLKLPRHKPCDKDEPHVIIIHTVWEGPLPQSTMLGLISTIYAHGPGCAKLMVHTTGNTSVMEQSLKSYMGSHVSVTKFNATHILELIVNRFHDLQATINENNNTPTFAKALEKKPPALGMTSYVNLLRILILAAYGGVYLDSDVLVLNSLAPLANYGKDFWYRWSNQKYCNNAVLFFEKGSPAIQALAKEIIKLGGVKKAASLCHCKRMTPRVGTLVEMLPSAYFDPSWVMYDKQLTATQRYASKQYGAFSFGSYFFQAKQIAHARDGFFPGAFAYHWHNQFDEPFGNNSIAETFWLYFNDLRTSGAYLK